MQLHRLAACPVCGRQVDVDAGGELAGLRPGETFACSCGARVTVPSGRAEDAAVVRCASCGAPRRGDESACGYCGADFTLRERDLDAICPRCAARVSRRGHYCHHCGLPLTAPREAVPTALPCPACRSAAGAPDGATSGPVLVSRRLGAGDALHLFECPRCSGMWLDDEVFGRLVERARRGRTGLAPPPRRAGGEAERRWSYRPCPLCGGLMSRRNYGGRSGVILDVCSRHGVWFDGDELRRTLDWVRRGGATAAEQATPGAARPLAGSEDALGSLLLDRPQPTLGEMLVVAAGRLARWLGTVR